MITFGSLFAGIGGFDLGLEQNRMKCLWQVEIDTKCNDVLANHWPNVERYTDVKEVGRHNLQPVDLVCGGFPCQDVSVAGRRAGLAGKRSGLWWEFHRVIAELQPRWCIIENVPGLLSSNEGRDMGAILWALGELRYGWAYRILDAQYFGVAQRRRRVFIVGCLGDAGRAAQVLFEPESCKRDTAPSRETRKAIADGTGGSIAGSVSRKWAKGTGGPSGDERYNLVVEPIVAMHETGQGWWNESDVAGTLRAEGENRPSRPSNIIAYNIQQNDGGQHKRKDRPNGGMYVTETEQSLTLGSTDKTVVAFTHSGYSNKPAWITGQRTDAVATIQHPSSHQGVGIIHASGIRRLTPVECERLQGFPNGWTRGQSDSARYKQLGNAVAVPVVEWIGQRIVASEGDDTLPD